MNAVIGDRIRQWRETRRLTAKDLAGAVGVSASAISQIESGKTKAPTPITLMRISHRLGVSMEELIDPANVRFRTSEREIAYGEALSPAATELAKWFDTLKHEDQRRVIGAVLIFDPSVSNERAAKFLTMAPLKALQPG